MHLRVNNSLMRIVFLVELFIGDFPTKTYFLLLNTLLLLLGSACFVFGGVFQLERTPMVRGLC